MKIDKKNFESKQTRNKIQQEILLYFLNIWQPKENPNQMDDLDFCSLMKIECANTFQFKDGSIGEAKNNMQHYGWLNNSPIKKTSLMI